jgi:hypothetical protein
MTGMADLQKISKWLYLTGAIVFASLSIRHLVILSADSTEELWFILAIFFAGFYLRELRSVKRDSN